MQEDLRQAFRGAIRRPAFALATVATLALGLGATTAVFSVVNAALLRPYPHIDTDRWAYLYETSSAEGLSLLSVSIPNYRDWRREVTAFSDMALWFHWSYNLSGLATGDPERVQAVAITPEVFAGLGVAPAAGRWLAPDDTSRDVMIGHGLWQRRFGGDPAIVGRSIDLNLVPHRVVGVMPAAFSFPPETRTEVWVAFAARDIASAEGRDFRGNRVAARLRAGATFEQAQAEMDLVTQRLAAQHPEDKGYGARVVPLREDIAGDFRAPLLTLFGALALVLLLACVSLANLQLTRWESRRKELAVRSVLGAPAWKLGRQVVLESLALALVAGAIGMGMAPFGMRLLLSFVPAEQVPWLSVTIDRTVWLVAAGLTLSVGLLTGALAALRAARADLGEVLSGSGRGTGAASVGRRARQGFLVAQLALSLAPLAGAGLLIQSFVRLQRVDPGFVPERRLTLSYTAPRARYPEPAKIAALAETIGSEVRQIAGVEAAGLAQALPFGAGVGWLQALTRRDPAALSNPAGLPHVRYNVVSTGYVEALGVPLKAGRTFTRTDTFGAEPVVVINETLARRYFAGEDPLGQQVWVGHAQALAASPPRTIVGVVGDVRLERLDAPAEAAAWVPLSQQRDGETAWRSLFLVARTRTEPLGLLAEVRRQVAGADPDLALTDVRTLQDRLGESVWRQRLAANVLGALGVVAVLIAVLGVSGIVGFLVGRRTHEMGVRMALGATPRDVVSLVMREGGRLIVAGVVLGLCGAVVLGRSLSSLLYGVGVNDPATLAATGASLGAAALAACYLPARRAGKVAPLAALRDE